MKKQPKLKEEKIELSSELTAMISLLDDDDLTVFNAVSRKLVSVITGDRPEAAELMRRVVEKKSASPERVQRRLDTFIDDVQFQKLSPQFKRALLDGASLEDLALLIAQIGYPDADTAHFRREMGKLERQLKSEFTDAMSERDKVFLLSIVLFEQQGFKGNSGDYFNPDNSYITRVLEEKSGIPISLGALYLMLAERLRLPVYGVNMPAHFMLKFEKGGEELFIDPFNQGRILKKEDCIQFLTNAGYGYVDQYLARAATIDIAERMLNNLRNSYTELGNIDKAELIEKYLDVIRAFQDGDAPPTPSAELDDLFGDDFGDLPDDDTGV